MVFFWVSFWFIWFHHITPLWQPCAIAGTIIWFQPMVGNTRGNEYSEATATETHGNAQLLCAKSSWPRGHGEIELRCADLTNSAPIPRAPLATSEFAASNLGFSSLWESLASFSATLQLPPTSWRDSRQEKGPTTVMMRQPAQHDECYLGCGFPGSPLYSLYSFLDVASGNVDLPPNHILYDDVPGWARTTSLHMGYQDAVKVCRGMFHLMNELEMGEKKTKCNPSISFKHICEQIIKISSEKVIDFRADSPQAWAISYGSMDRQANVVITNSSPCYRWPIYRSMYHLVITNSAPWKDLPIFKFGKPSISINGPSIPWRTVSHNQRVYDIILELPGPKKVTSFALGWSLWSLSLI